MRILLLFFALFLLSCNGDVAFQEREAIANNVWTYDAPLSFTFEIKDTSRTYDVILDIEHTREFGYQNLYTGLHTIMVSGDTIFQQLSIDLADDLGQWLGTCKGAECSQQVLIRKSTSFPAIGSYQMIVEQLSRDAQLEGIKSVELTIVKGED
jgi:gliding motility-associated lipoprotein GldH